MNKITLPIHNKNNQEGFSLIELSVVMVILGLVVIASLALIPDLMDFKEKTHDEDLLASTDSALLGFALNNNRLPCPDTDAVPDGVEDCGGLAADGTLPYKTLGLSGRILDSQNYDVRYGVYRHALVERDLATSNNKFTPLLPGMAFTAPNGQAYGGNNSATAPDQNYINTQTRFLCGTILPSLGFPSVLNPPAIVATPFTSAAPPVPPAVTTTNVIDFCKGLDNAFRATATTPEAGSLRTVSGGISHNMAFVLATGGASDADNNGSPFEGVNANGLNFELPSRIVDENYDDIVHARSFVSLYQSMNCATRIGEVNAAANQASVMQRAVLAAITSTNNNCQALTDADVAALFAGFAVAIAALKTVSAIAKIAHAATQFAEGDAGAGVGLALAISGGVLAAANTIAAGVVLGFAIDRVIVYNGKVLDAFKNLEVVNAAAAAAFAVALQVESNGGIR